jgi:hypothetical protein
MISSARTNKSSGTLRPSALAVLRLMISSTFVDCWTGRSEGFHGPIDELNGAMMR